MPSQGRGKIQFDESPASLHPWESTWGTERSWSGPSEGWETTKLCHWNVQLKSHCSHSSHTISGPPTRKMSSSVYVIGWSINRNCKHTHTDTHTHMHTYTHPYTYAHTYNIYTHVYILMHTPIYTHLYIYTFIHIHMHVHTYLCTPIRTYTHIYMCFPGGASGKEPACQYRRHKRHGFGHWARKIPWRRAWQPTPVFCLENTYTHTYM